MTNEVEKKLVVVDHNGSCGAYRYQKGVPVALPQSVLDAIGEDSYSAYDEAKAKNIKTAKNKAMQGADNK